jgi:hypothetical protein
MEPHGTAIFCDDVRYEVNGKISLIGIYGPDLVVLGELPTVLPLFWISVFALFPPEKPVGGVQVLVYLPGDTDEKPSIAVDLPWSFEPSDVAEKPPHADALASLYFRHQLALPRLQLKEAGFIRVRLIHGEQRIRVGALRISRKDPDPANRPPKAKA